jgi:hypothetical protein
VVQPLDACAWMMRLVANAVVIELRLSQEATWILHRVVGLRLLVLREASPLTAAVLLLLEPAVLVARRNMAGLSAARDGARH